MPIIFSQFERDSNLKYGFSERTDGSMHRRLETKNRNNYFQKKGIRLEQIVTADLVHGSDVIKVDKTSGGAMLRGDGLITNERNLFLSATGADCFLIYFFDPIKQVIGIAHAGWRGVLGGLLKNVVKSIQQYQSNPADILVGISPGIRRCHFEVSAADNVKYAAYPNAVFEQDQKVFIDLPEIIKTQLKAYGISEQHIEDTDECTYCKAERYFSYRRDAPSEVQPMVGYIGFVA